MIRGEIFFIQPKELEKIDDIIERKYLRNRDIIKKYIPYKGLYEITVQYEVGSDIKNECWP